MRSIRNSTLDDIDDVARVGELRREPAAGQPAGRVPISPLHGNQMPQGELEPEKNYQVNVAFQRDIGFNTVAEVAWVGNYRPEVLARRRP